MRKSWSIIKATALEGLSEPLTLLVLLAALTLAVLAPTFHCHQFGEPTRMARDAGFSAAFVASIVLALFGTIRSFRREVETGTLEMALAHPVSLRRFFLSKTLGCWMTSTLIGCIVFFTSLAIVAGAAIGGRLADRTGDVARLWGPTVAAGTAVILVPLFVGALLNRFARRRFTLTALLSALVLSVVVAGWAVFLEGATLAPLLPAFLPQILFTALVTSASAAFALRLRANAAAALSGLVLAVLFPFFGNYYLADALSCGGRVSWPYPLEAALVTAPALAAFLFSVRGARWSPPTIASGAPGGRPLP